VRSTPYLRHVAETWHIWRDVSEQALVEAETPSNASSFGARLNIQQLSQSSKYITFKDESRRTRVDRSHIGGDILLSFQFWPIPSMSRRRINCAKLCLSHSFSRIKGIGQWAVDRAPVLTSTTSAKIGKAAIGTSGGRSTPKTQLGRPIWCFGASKSPKRRSPTVPRGCHVRGVRWVAMTENDEAGAVPWNEATCDLVMPWRVRQWRTGPWLGALRWSFVTWCHVSRSCGRCRARELSVGHSSHGATIQDVSNVRRTFFRQCVTHDQETGQRAEAWSG